MEPPASIKVQKRRRGDEDEDISAPVDREERSLMDKAIDKGKKKFSVALIRQAVSCAWEDHDIARLIILIAKERQLSNEKTFQLVQSGGVCTPVVLSTLADEDYMISATQMIGAMYDQAEFVDQFIEVRGDDVANACEHAHESVLSKVAEEMRTRESCVVTSLMYRAVHRGA